MRHELSNCSRKWLGLGIYSLAASGLFSIIVAVAWHPSVKSVSLFATLFQRALIAHVNLSVSLWFICVMFMLWECSIKRAGVVSYFSGLCDRYARWMIAIAIAAITTASLLPGATPYLNNYVPMLDHPLFVLALGLVLSALALKVLQLFYVQIIRVTQTDGLDCANLSLAAIVLAMLAAFIASGALIRDDLTGETRYEVLFWGGGHTMQFAWSGLLIICWALLLAYGYGLAVNTRLFIAIISANALYALSGIWPYLAYDVNSPAFRQTFTLLMIWLGGLAAILFGVWTLIRLRHASRRADTTWYNPALTSLWWSVTLFAVGGAFSVMIDGINVKIPAHYHGSLLAVTMAAMGVSYIVLEAFGYQPVTRSKTAIIQPHLLGVGQIVHIFGLYISGGYGVQRKSPGAESSAMEQADLILRIQSTGGGVAILGGLLFVIVMWRAFRHQRRIERDKA